MAAPDQSTHVDPAAAPASGVGPALSVVVVTHDSAAEIERTLPAIVAELRPGDELLICDNASSDGTPERARALAPEARVLPAEANRGFGAAANAGAREASGELLLLLNPDAVVAPGFRAAIELPLLEGRGWEAWQALVTAEDGAVVNTWGGVVHFSGLAWAGGAGRPLADAPDAPREVAFASGACLAIRRSAWEALGGFSDHYFLYHEDTELGLRLRLAGHRVGIEPRARVEHEYEFEKGAHKWYFLERNRYATIVRVYPPRLLVALLPGLLVIELAILLVAALGGWLPQKLRADGAAIRALPRLLTERREIQGRAGAGASGELARQLTPELDSAYLGAAARSAPLAALLRLYWRAVRLLVG